MKRVFLILISIFLANSATAQDYIDDSQFFTETWLYAPKPNDTWDYGYINFTRFGRDSSRVTDERQALFATYTFSPLLKITPMFSYIEQEPPSSVKSKQYRPLVDFTGVYDLKYLRLTYRLRGEHQFRESLANKWNFRPRAGFEVPLAVGGLSPYIFANIESFYDSILGQWYRYRGLTGIGCALTDKIAIDIYVGRQLQWKGTKSDFSLVGTILKLKF